MITGPANFPTRRNQKRLDTAHKRLKELLDFRQKARDRLHKTYNPRILANAPISADDLDAIEQLQVKIDKAEKRQELMKAVNKIAKSKKSDDDKIAELGKLEVSEKTARKMLAERFTFQPYELTNNNANIRRMKERVQQLQQERSKTPAGDTVINGVTVSENTDLNRLQLFFPGKPSVEIRDRLKARGFHWSPREGAWQRQLNDVARQVARQMLEALN